MTVIKVIHRACKPEEFLFQFKLVCHWSLPSLPWENPPDAWMVQHLGCADRLTLSWKARAKPCLPLAMAGGAVRWAQDLALQPFPSVPALGAFGRGSAAGSSG